MRMARWQRKQWWKHRCRGMLVVSAYRTLPVRPYPCIPWDLPQPEIDYPPVDFEGSSQVVKYRRFVLLRELVLCVAAYWKNYLTRMQVLPMAPSPTMTSFMGTGSLSIRVLMKYIGDITGKFHVESGLIQRQAKYHPFFQLGGGVVDQHCVEPQSGLLLEVLAALLHRADELLHKLLAAAFVVLMIFLLHFWIVFWLHRWSYRLMSILD